MLSNRATCALRVIRSSCRQQQQQQAARRSGKLRVSAERRRRLVGPLAGGSGSAAGRRTRTGMQAFHHICFGFAVLWMLRERADQLATRPLSLSLSLALLWFVSSKESERCVPHSTRCGTLQSAVETGTIGQLQHESECWRCHCRCLCRCHCLWSVLPANSESQREMGTLTINHARLKLSSRCFCCNNNNSKQSSSSRGRGSGRSSAAETE